LREAWTVAIETLSWMEMQKLSERLALARTIKQLGASNPHAIRYGYGLVVETTRHRNLIDKFINTTAAPKKIGQYQLGIQSFLRLYVYQVRITKNWTKINVQEAAHITSMGRAILGWQTLREVEPILGFLLTRRLELILKSEGDEKRIGLQTFHPSWFVKYCFRLMGRNEAIAFLKGSIAPPPTYIRVNTLIASEETILQKLDAEGIKLEKTLPLRNTYKVLEAKKSLNMLSSYNEGLFYIQDKASCFAAETTSPKHESIVFDICSAPGAKTSYLAQLMRNNGAIYAVDFSNRRMQAWKKEIARMKVEIAQPIIADALAPLPLYGQADFVVLDPPCTSTGVFAKQPSAKWRIGPKSIEKMAAIQWKMINNCAEKVAAGGTLTYSTCSITAEENEIIVERFLKWHPEFYLMEIMPKMGLPGMRGLTKCQRLYPHIHQCNGFFMAKLKRTM